MLKTMMPDIFAYILYFFFIVFFYFIVFYFAGIFDESKVF